MKRKLNIIKDIESQIIYFTKRRLFLNIYKTDMKLLLFIKKLLKNIINTNNLVVVLNLLRNTNYFYILIIALVISVEAWFPSKITTILGIMSVIKIIPLIIFVIVYSIFISVFVYIIYLKRENMPKRVLKYSNIKGVSKFSNFFDYYYTLLPVCMVTTGLTLATLYNFHIYSLFFGAALFFLGVYLFFILSILKVTFYNMGTYDTYNNITRANDIFINYISSDKTRKTGIEYLAIKEFTKCFGKVLDGIDFHFGALFDNRINIDYLQTKENITVKQLIIRYLPLYLNYCNKTELNYFEIKLNSMVKLIDNENMINSLDIIKIIYSIHQDIATFLNQHSYVAPQNTLLANLIYNTKKRSSTFSEVFISIFVIIGLFKVFIPYEILNKVFELFNGTLSNLFDIKYIALIPPFLASMPILYNFLKDSNK